ncbi:MAG: DUF4255 domain-containing protein [Paludibacteraceae bacterium]|nr:DUF4255 domain-containing protein [Paludibacteraceae bacterium]MBR4841206.1 DUF4255 domain-containing protein [Paludibacteraceae bacterium]
MIKKILKFYADKMDQYVSRSHPQQEGCVEVGFIGNSVEARPNKIRFFLFSAEREPTPNANAMKMSGTTNGSGYPDLAMNLNVLIAAIFEEKKYSESLSFFSEALAFIQSCPVFTVEGVRYTVEVVSLGLSETNNMWSCLGSQCFPSVMCKIRRLLISSGTISKVAPVNKGYQLDN